MLSQRRLDIGSSHWLDLTGASEEELKSICAQYGLTEELALDCLDSSALPKLQRLPVASFLMLRGFDEKASSSASTVQEMTHKLAVLWGENFLVTIHRTSLPWVDEVWAAWKGKSPAPLARLVHDLVEASLFTYELPIDADAEVMSEIEDRIFAERSTKTTSGATLEKAYLVKKRAFTYKRLLRLTRDTLPTVSKLGEEGNQALQLLKEEADRLFFYADDLAESASDLVQLSISMSSNRMNDLVRLLTIVSIFLLPLNLITGIYGMNFEVMPELKMQYGYPLALGVMLVFVVVMYFVLRWRGWIRAGRKD